MKRFSIFWFLLVLPFGLMAFALADGGSLSEVQIYVVGFIASALVYALKFLSERFPQWTIKREWLTVLLYAISFGLSLMWSGFVLPTFEAFSDPLSFMAAVLGWASALLTLLAPSVAFATLIYNLFLKRVFDSAALKIPEKA